MLERIQLLRNIGQFSSVSTGAQIPLSALTLVYGENGRGKTTLSSVLRSVCINEPALVQERHRLGAAHPPHIVFGFTTGQVQFQGGTWSSAMPQIAVFDDSFVASNVCSGIEIAADHRQNLHELILGAQGVTLNRALQGHVDRIEEHNRALTAKGQAIPAALRGALSVDEFCLLTPDADIENSIGTAERALAAARSADTIRQQADFRLLTLPEFDTSALNALLAQTLPDLETEAAARVKAHLKSLGRGGEAWINDGMGRLGSDSQGQGHELCPFCAQDLTGSPLIRHYQVYFSEAYEGLKAAITQTGQGVNTTHGGEIPAAFERLIRVTAQSRVFWATFMNVPEVDIDTAAVLRAWTAAREAVLAVLRAKAAAPLEAMTLSPESLALIEAYAAQRGGVIALSDALQACNPTISVLKEQAANANVGARTADLARLQAVRSRHNHPVAGLCTDYLLEKEDKAATELLRTQARTALNDYRQNIFPAYENSINSYLGRFNAGFRLASVSPQNTRGGSSCTYNVVINNVQIPVMSTSGPAFRNTLSAGDRNTLALAFFFASLDRDQQLDEKILVIDDPMTSLDEHRSLTTVQEMRRMQTRVRQIIVLSHSKPFLCQLWEGADTAMRQAVLIRRDGLGSTLMLWDVNQDCITEHDHRHALVEEYLQTADPTTERRVAAALRHILEAFMRVAYPATFPPGRLLGPFLGICEQRVGQHNQILVQTDIEELRALLAYVNRFHHDTNAAYETASINDQELTHFCNRVLAFARRS